MSANGREMRSAFQRDADRRCGRSSGLRSIATRRGSRTRADATRACGGATHRAKEGLLVGGEEARDALLQTSEIAPKPLFATLCRIGVACGLQPAGELALDQAALFEQLSDPGPCDPIEKILADRAAVAKRSAEPEPGIGTETTIIIDRAGARSRRCPVERVATVGTGHQALHHTGHDRTARCVRFVGFQTLLGEGEGLIIDDRRHWNRDPLVLRPLMVCTVTRRNN